MLLNRQVHHTTHLGHAIPDCLGQTAQALQILAKDFHRDIGPRAGQHVVNTVGDRLADGDAHARHDRERTA